MNGTLTSELCLARKTVILMSVKNKPTKLDAMRDGLVGWKTL
jgi:hypothetical protein